MSCGCSSGSSYDGGIYGGVCDADTPYPSVSHESVPSLIDNLVYALYGAIEKDVTSGKVVWNIPCDPSNIPATINGIPRNDGEGLLCYIVRALNLTTPSGFVTVNGIQTLTNKTLTAPVINNAPITATGSTTARTLENRFADIVNVLDFGADPTGVVDSTDKIQAAINATGNGTLYFPAGTYRCSGELLITSALTMQGNGRGQVRNLQPYDPDSKIVTTRLLFTGTGAKSIKTRVNYRASSGDPSDAPISTAINIQMDGVTIRDLMVELYCDYSNASPTNYGDNWDVGIFHGSRQDLRLIDVNVVGYWRQASIWLDSTRGVNLPELNGYPVTFGAGADGISLVRVNVTGGKWGVLKQGPMPKTGLRHQGYLYKRAAKFVFSGQPADGDTLTVGSDIYTFRTSATMRLEVTIGATLAATIDNLILKLQQDILVPYDELTFLRSGSELVIYSTSSTATAMSDVSTNIAVQTLAGGVATQTETIADPAPFYDAVAGIVDDGRGALGASDNVYDNCVICSVEHHSKYRKTDFPVSPNVDTDTTSAGALWINGLGGTGVIHRQFANNTRFQSAEPFTVRLGFAARCRFVSCTADSDYLDWKTTSGGIIGPNDTYGKYAASSTRSALIQILGYDDAGAYFPLNVNSNQIYSHFYLQGNDIKARRDLSVNRFASIGDTNTDATTGYVEVKGGKNANSEVRFSREDVATVGRVRVSNNGGMSLSVRPSGTGSITDALFLSSSTFQVYSAPRPETDNSLTLGTASLKWSTLFTNSIQIGGSSGPTISTGSGSPEGVVTAPIGSLYTNSSGGASTTLYVKTSGTGNTGWTAK